MKSKSVSIIYNEDLEEHERETISYLKSHGFKVKRLTTINKNHVKSPDISFNGLSWEMKSPMSCNHNTLEHTFDKGLKQSPNLIYDLRRIKISSRDTSVADQMVQKLHRLFDTSRRAKKLWIITKTGELIKYEK